VGTRTRFDIRNYVFNQTMKHVDFVAVKLPIAFPTLISGVIMSQHPTILYASNVLSKRESPLTLHYMLFVGTRVQDIGMPSCKEAGTSTSKKAIIF